MKQVITIWFFLYAATVAAYIVAEPHLNPKPGAPMPKMYFVNVRFEYMAFPDGTCRKLNWNNRQMTISPLRQCELKTVQTN